MLPATIYPQTVSWAAVSLGINFEMLFFLIFKNVIQLLFRPFGPISYTFSPESGSQLIVAQVEDPDTDYPEGTEDIFNKNSGIEFEVFVAALLSSYLEKQFFYVEKIPQPDFTSVIDQVNLFFKEHSRYKNFQFSVYKRRIDGSSPMECSTRT